MKDLENGHLQAIKVEVQRKFQKQVSKIAKDITSELMEKFRIKCKKFCLKYIKKKKLNDDQKIEEDESDEGDLE